MNIKSLPREVDRRLSPALVKGGAFARSALASELRKAKGSPEIVKAIKSLATWTGYPVKA
jgi:hypothetical protein